jgi:histidinol phosphatase-like enzyme
MKTFVIDIDGTICSDSAGQYEKAVPINSRIDAVNKLYDEGNVIIFLTARGMGSSGNNIEAAKEKWFDFTKKQLEDWGVKYHSLFLGKPAADQYVDDKGVPAEVFFEN